MISKKGNVINYIISITLLLIFAVAIVVIAITVYHASLLPSGSTVATSSSPIPCKISIVNSSTPSQWIVTVEDGSPGLTYKVFMVSASQTSMVGSYIAGENTYTKTISVSSSGSIEFIGNTTGSSKSVNGNTYSAGGTCEAVVT
jgi:hypothetical protein